MAETVGEALREASADLTAKPDGGEKSKATSERTTTREAPSREAHDDDDGDFGAPGWVKQWKKPSRAALRRLAQLEGAADLLPEVYKEVESRYDYTGKQQAEFEQYRKRWEPYSQVLTPLEQQFQMQGIHPQTGLQQMAMVSQALRQNPDETIPWLLSQFPPRDAKALVQAIAQNYNVDLSGLAAAAPYIDPVVSQEISTLRQQNQQIAQALQYQHQQQYYAAAQQVAGAIQAFKSAADENGNPKYPHYDRLDGIMANIVRTEGPKPLEQLYEQAMWQDPELREELIQSRAKKAESQAIQDANRRNVEAEKAMGASRNVNGKTSAGKPKNPADLRALLKQESKRLTG